MNPAHICAVVDTVMKPRRTRGWYEIAFETEVEVEIYPGLRLDGYITCLLQLDQYNGDIVALADHHLKVKDKDENDVVVDWDDLKDYTIDKIESQVRRAYRDME